MTIFKNRKSAAKSAKARSFKAFRAAIESLEGRMLLTAVVVNTTLDGPLASSMGLISLRSAVSMADSSASPTAITFDPTVFATAQTITLDGNDLEFNNTSYPTTITGPAAGVTLNGNQQAGGFQIDRGVTAAISNITVSGDAASGDNLGDGIYNDGALSLNNVTVSNNAGSNGKYGGGIYNDKDGTATLANVTISGNKSGGNPGGGIYNGGIASLTNVTISGNASGGGNGSGIFNNGTATVTNATISGNTSADNGGGIFNNGTATLANVTVSGNTASSYDGAGGGVFNRGAATLTNVAILGNTVSGEAVDGGGIFNASNSTAILTNVTISGNTASGGHPFGFGASGGGGIANATTGTATLTNVTISGNTVSAESGGGGGIDNGANATSFTIANTVDAGNASSVGSTDASGGFNSLGRNLIGETDGSSGWLLTDLQGSVANPLNAKLGPLAINGGPTKTVLPLTGSPAIGAGSVALIPAGVTTDQRGLPRVLNGKVDIGAVEVQPAASIALTAPASQTATAGIAASFALGTFIDSNTTGPFTIDVNWGDGTVDTIFTQATTGAVMPQSHTFANAASDMISVSVIDADHNTSNIATFTATVTATSSIPVITGQPTNQTGDVGQTVTFTAAASGSPTPTVQWRVSTDNGTSYADIPGATSTTLTIVIAAGEDGYLYEAMFSNSPGSATSDPASLTVTTAPMAPVVTTQPGNQTVIAGQSVTFTAAAGGSPTPAVQWQMSLDGTTYTDIAGATSTTYTFTATTAENGYFYQAVFTNSAGMTPSASASLTVLVPPTVGITAPAVNAGGGAGETITVVYTGVSDIIKTSTIVASNLTIVGPSNSSATLSVAVFNIYVNGNTATATYVVTPSNGIWQASNNGPYNVSIAAGAVTDEGGAGCVAASASFTVSATTVLVLTNSSSASADQGQSVNFTAALSGEVGGTPTGTVEFFSDGAAIGMAPVGANGSAKLVAAAPPPGSHAITSVYSGDSTYPSITSSLPQGQTVSPVPPLAVVPTLIGSLPGLVIAGQPTLVRQTITVSNPSGITFGESVTATFYLSADGSIGSGAILLPVNIVKQIKLKSSKKTVLHWKSKGVPLNIPPGVYYLVVELTGLGGATSQAASMATITVQAAQPDLSVAIPSIPLAETIGKPITATIVVTNGGNIPLSGPLLLVFYSSTSSQNTVTNDTKLTQMTKRISLKPGRPLKLRVNKIMLSSVAGMNYLKVQIDPANTFGDVNLANNVAVGAAVTVG